MDCQQANNCLCQRYDHWWVSICFAAHLCRSHRESCIMSLHTKLMNEKYTFFFNKQTKFHILIFRLCTKFFVIVERTSQRNYVPFIIRRSLIAMFVRPTWGPYGADRTHVGPMFAPWKLCYLGNNTSHDVENNHMWGIRNKWILCSVCNYPSRLLGPCPKWSVVIEYHVILSTVWL